MKTDHSRTLAARLCRTRWSLAALATGVAFALGGCGLPSAQPDPTRFYMLTDATAVHAAEASAAPAPAPAKRWRLGLRPVQLPDFLHGRAMFVHLSGNEVRFMDDARWAEPLDAAVARVLRESLESRPEIARVAASVALANEPSDADVLVRVIRCEGDAITHVARFVATVELYPSNAGGERRAQQTFSTEIPGWDGKDYDQLAEKLSEAVAQLADRTIALLGTLK